MREERGNIAGPVVIDEPYTLWGSVGGDVIVVDGGKFYMRGSIYGSLKVEDGGRVHIYGNISRDLIVGPGTKVIHSGNLAGDAINNGGRLFVDATATIRGKVKTVGGETKFEPMPEGPGGTPAGCGLTARPCHPAAAESGIKSPTRAQKPGRISPPVRISFS